MTDKEPKIIHKFSHTEHVAWDDYDHSSHAVFECGSCSGWSCSFSTEWEHVTCPKCLKYQND